MTPRYLILALLALLWAASLELAAGCGQHCYAKGALLAATQNAVTPPAGWREVSCPDW